jgi:hypothetical protein
MGTGVAYSLVDLFLYSLEVEFIHKLYRINVIFFHLRKELDRNRFQRGKSNGHNTPEFQGFQLENLFRYDQSCGSIDPGSIECVVEPAVNTIIL